MRESISVANVLQNTAPSQYLIDYRQKLIDARASQQQGATSADEIAQPVSVICKRRQAMRCYVEANA